MISLLNRAYLQPFQNRRMLTVYMAVFLGTVANIFLSLYIALDTMRLGWMGMTTYLYAWFLPAGLLLFPLFYVLYTRLSRRALVIAVVGSQCAGFLLFLVSPLSQTPWGLGIMMVLFSTGYWQMYHGNMAAHIHSRN